GSFGAAVIDPGWFFRFSCMITLVGGTMFLMWVGEQITARGIGNGTSLIIMAGIVANLPTAFASMLEMGRTGALSPFFILLFLVIADDQFALATADWYHRVNSLEACCHRLMNRFTVNNSGGLDLNLAEAACVDGAFTIDRLANGVNNTTNQCIANRYFGNTSGALDGVAFLDLGEFSENGSANIIFFQVEDHAGNTAGELKQLTGHGASQAMNTGNTVTDGDNSAGLRHFNLFAILFDLFFDYLADLFGSDFHGCSYPFCNISLIRLS
ncbi:MAG: hypothetical protein HIU83_02290, partial [Proteobacteria bacterium]|nr:hypothetical protein [Pseudomonadota bacterium]